MTLVALATEDELSEAVGERLLKEAGITVALKLRRGGCGYLKANAPKFLEMAKWQPLLIVTDLDSSKCPEKLRDRWFGNRVLPKGLLFRVAVREVEAWLLADPSGIKKLLGNRIAPIPRRPDDLVDPKQALLVLARRAVREIKEDLIAPAGALATQGLGYNNRLRSFVENTWDPRKAAENSPSLARARERLSTFCESSSAS